MEGFESIPVYIPLNEQEGSISLIDYGYVIGFSIEVTDQSQDAIMMYGYNESPKLRINQGDDARGIGGNNVCGIPCCYRGKVNWKFTTALAPDGILIVHTLKSTPISIAE